MKTVRIAAVAVLLRALWFGGVVSPANAAITDTLTIPPPGPPVVTTFVLIPSAVGAALSVLKVRVVNNTNFFIDVCVQSGAGPCDRAVPPAFVLQQGQSQLFLIDTALLFKGAQLKATVSSGVIGDIVVVIE
jgi:hypothetical protein